MNGNRKRSAERRPEAPPGEAGDYIVVRGLSKAFGSHQVLNRLSLTVRRGESMVVIGGSGTGKSVLIKCILRLVERDAGEVWIDGRNTATLPPRELDEMRKKFGMLFQYAALFDSLPVWMNVGFALMRHTKMHDHEVKERAIEKLRRVGLEGVENLMPSELSGGMRKRVGLARAIAMEPELLFYDEPTTGLDPIAADMINELIVDLRENMKVTSIAITHDMVSAYKIAHRIAMLYEGGIHAVGTPEEIRSSPDPIVQQFIRGSAKGPITDRLRARGDMH